MTAGAARIPRMQIMHKTQGFASSSLNPHVSHLQKSLQLHLSQLILGRLGHEQSRLGQEQSRLGQEQSNLGQEQSNLGQDQLLDSAHITHRMQSMKNNARNGIATPTPTTTMNTRDPTNVSDSDDSPLTVDVDGNSVRGIRESYMTRPINKSLKYCCYIVLVYTKVIFNKLLLCRMIYVSFSAIPDICVQPGP